VTGVHRVRAHLEIVRDPAGTFPIPDDPLQYCSARIWHCGFRCLSGVGLLRNLRKLEVAGYPDPTLEPLRALGRLEHLSMVHLPEVTSLEPLSCLSGLRWLTLAALPEWNPASKPVELESLIPLSSLPALEEVNLLGVELRDRSVRPLWRIPSLRRARLAHYPASRRLTVEPPDRW
jgi:hypothetical protein